MWPGDSPRERDPVRGTHARRDMSHPLVLRTRGFAVTVAVLAGVSAKVYVMLCYSEGDLVTSTAEEGDLGVHSL